MFNQDPKNASFTFQQPFSSGSFEIQQPQEPEYLPTTLLKELPRSEQMKYENKEKYIEKNREKILLIKRRSIEFVDQIEEKLMRTRTKHFSLLRTINYLNRQYLDLKRDDGIVWKAVEEAAVFYNEIKKGEFPTIEDKTKCLEYLAAKIEETLQDIKEAVEKITKRIKNTKEKEKIAQKTITNILIAQQEAYRTIISKYFQLVEEVTEQKERYKQIRREAYSDYSDPFKKFI